MQKLLSKLSEAFGPSGMEDDVRDFIVEELSESADDINVDALGNLFVTRKASVKSNKKRIMFAAHMDEIGLIVTHVDKKGFLRVSPVGGIDYTQLVGQRFRFYNNTLGTIYHEKLKEYKDLEWSKLYMDIGALDKKDALKKVNIGDMAVFDRPFNNLGKRFIGKAMDNRAGCAVLAETFKRLPRKLNNELVFVFTVQEEVGVRGARGAAYNINPDYAIAVDVTRVGDTPKAPLMDVSLGSGPAVKIKDSLLISHPFVRKLMTDTAAEKNISYQLEVLEQGGTDAGAIHLSRSGIPSGVLSIPCRYVHSASEMVDVNDLENAAKLLKEICLSAKWKG